MAMKTMRKGIEIMLPGSFTQLDLGNPISKEKAREVIQEYKGRVVLLSDTHSCLDKNHYISGIPQPIKEDSECYEFQFLFSGEKQEHHYHDLEGLMVPVGSHIRIKTLE